MPTEGPKIVVNCEHEGGPEAKLFGDLWTVKAGRQPVYASISALSFAWSVLTRTLATVNSLRSLARKSYIFFLKGTCSGEEKIS